MAIDYCVELECEPKRQLGQNDCREGATRLLELLKSRNRAAMLRQMAQKSGQDPQQLKVTLNVPDREGKPIRKEVTLAELEGEARILETLGTACAGCPVNLVGQLFGCFGAVHYPIPAAAERWLLGRVQPPGSAGAWLCLEYLTSFGLTGESIRNLRKTGFFEARAGSQVALEKGLFKRRSLSADQLLESILMTGSPLNPGHCFGVLVWLGAISLDGAVPAQPGDPSLAVLAEIQSWEEKQNRTRLELGGEANFPEAEPFATLLKALYLSWVHDAPLFISA
jgi:hypothetical protein